MIVLVGRAARDNDILSLRLAAPRDFWLHLAGDSGSHVVVRNPNNLDRLPRETKLFAASLAAGYSKAKNAGTVSVHLTRCSEVSKPRGWPPGKVRLGRFESVLVKPSRAGLPGGG
jgi:predicted ribosome quality control (RQC) complex YloA/Tae2 family protein